MAGEGAGGARGGRWWRRHRPRSFQRTCPRLVGRCRRRFVMGSRGPPGPSHLADRACARAARVVPRDRRACGRFAPCGTGVRSRSCRARWCRTPPVRPAPQRVLRTCCGAGAHGPGGCSGYANREHLTRRLEMSRCTHRVACVFTRRTPRRGRDTSTPCCRLRKPHTANLLVTGVRPGSTELVNPHALHIVLR